MVQKRASRASQPINFMGRYHSKYIGNTQEIDGKYMGNIHRNGKYMGNTWEILGIYTGNTWEIHRKYTGNTQEIHGKYTGNTWEIHRKYTEVFPKYFLSSQEVLGK